MKADIHTTYEALIPSFYTEVFKEQDVLERYLKGVDLVHMQATHDCDRYARYTSVYEADPMDTSVSENIHLTKTERTMITYGSGLSYGDTDVNYGDQATSPYGVYDLGDPLIKSIGYIADGIDNPTHIYTEGIDFFVDNGLVIFVHDLSEMFTQFEDDDGDGLVDEPNVVLTGYNVRRNRQELNKQFGYVFGIDTPPTTLGNDVFKGLWKLFTFGPSWYWTLFTLSRALGSDVIRTKKENVVAIKSGTPYGNVVITQNNTYVVSDDPVSVGDTLYYGYPVSTGIDVLHELSGTFSAAIPGVTHLYNDGDAAGVEVYRAPAEDGGDMYLLPGNLIIIEVSADLSAAETSKLIDVFEAVLSKNTKMIIIFGTAAEGATWGNSPNTNDSPLALEAAIMETTTDTDVSKHISKLRMSTR